MCLAFSVLFFSLFFSFFLVCAVSDLSFFRTSKLVLSNFSPFCRALLPFHYCLLLTGTFLHYYQEALVWGSIPCVIYHLLATCLYLNSSDRLYHPNTRTLLRIRGRADDATISLSVVLAAGISESRKLRNKSILLPGFLFSSPLRT